MNFLFQTILLAVCFMLVSCDKSEPNVTERDLERLIEEKAAERAAAMIEEREASIIEERERTEAYAEVEALRIAEERARFSDMAAEKRGVVVMDLAEREAERLAEREMNMEAAAIEKVRRERVAAEIKHCVDRINIRLRGEISGFKEQLFINEREAKGDMIIVSPAGYTLKYKGTDGDYYIFEYDDGLINVKAKRTSRGLSFATISHLKDLAKGFPALGTDSPVVAPADHSAIASRQVPRGSTRFYVIKATYGANNTHKDVTSIVRQKIHKGRLEFNAGSSQLGGDPIWGETKTFKIKYLSRGRINEKSFREGSRVNLP